MAFPSQTTTACAFGILGNIVSFLVYLAPAPTFYRIFKKKSSDGFQAIPYAVALFSAMLYLYYASLKQSDKIILVTINTVGFIMESMYLTIHIVYATRKSRVFTTKLIVGFNMSSLGIIIGATHFAARGPMRVTIVGWICAVFSVSVFAAPLSIMRKVIQTKSVEYMPFSLSFFLTICSVVWFFYGFLISDFYIATPNVIGFVFGVIQMVLYAVYKNKNKNENEKQKQKQNIENQAISLSETKVHDIVVELKSLDQIINQDENKREIEVVVLGEEQQVTGDDV